MAHLIDNTAGVNAIAYRGETPWHGLGAKMAENEPLESWIVRAGLGWQAKKTPVLFGDDNGIQTLTGKSVIYRDDTRAPLGVVGDGYQIVQPRDVIEFYRDLTERHGFQMETAGAIKEGRTVWALARTGDAMRISGTDVVGGYLLLSTSFDGTAATTGRFTTVRVVCNNTLTAAHNSKPQVSVGHRSKFDMDAAKVKLGVGDTFANFQLEAQRMAEVGVTPQKAIEYFLAVYHNMTSAQIVEAQAQKTTDKTIERLAQHFIAGPGAELASAKGTVWGLLNAVTYDVDHSSRARSNDSRLNSAWFGQGERTKNAARELALALAA